MKIKYDIQDKYKEIEIHLCNNEKNSEIMSIREALINLMEMKIKVVKEQESRLVATSQIIRIYSANKKVYVRTKDDYCYEVKDRIYTLEEQLKDKDFVRISNSELVNVNEIEKLDMSSAGTIKMHMKNGDVTYVSRRYVSKIKKVLL